MKQTRPQSEFNCLSEYTRLYPNDKHTYNDCIRKIIDNIKVETELKVTLLYTLWVIQEH